MARVLSHTGLSSPYFLKLFLIPVSIAYIKHP